MIITAAVVVVCMKIVLSLQLDEVKTENGSQCKEWQFACDNQVCIPLWKACNAQHTSDGRRYSWSFDCEDWSDETPKACQQVCIGPNKFLCNDTKRCIQRQWVCNGRSDCLDSTDEDGCLQRNCDDNFMCTDKSKCIEKQLHNDLFLICNGHSDCSDDSDERDCHDQDCKGNFKCKDDNDKDKCINNRFVCSGHPACSDGSDEGSEGECLYDKCNAAGWLMCKDGSRCIHYKWICDHERQCVDGSDEKNCANASYTYVPLIKPSPKTETPAPPPLAPVPTAPNDYDDDETEYETSFLWWILLPIVFLIGLTLASVVIAVDWYQHKHPNPDSTQMSDESFGDQPKTKTKTDQTKTKTDQTKTKTVQRKTKTTTSPMPPKTKKPILPKVGKQNPSKEKKQYPEADSTQLSDGNLVDRTQTESDVEKTSFEPDRTQLSDGNLVEQLQTKESKKVPKNEEPQSSSTENGETDSKESGETGSKESEETDSPSIEAKN